MEGLLSKQQIDNMTLFNRFLCMAGNRSAIIIKLKVRLSYDNSVNVYHCPCIARVVLGANNYTKYKQLQVFSLLD